MKKVFIFLMMAISGACTYFEVAEIDPATGYIKANREATIITSKDIELDEFKSLLLISDSEFLKEQVQAIDYFDELMTQADLEKDIIRNNLQEKVPTVRDQIGLNKAYKNYRKFLSFEYDSRGTGTEKYSQFKLVNPGTLEDIFVAEIKLDAMVGINDQYTCYPLFNALIRYIKNHSKSYRDQMAEKKSVAVLGKD